MIKYWEENDFNKFHLMDTIMAMKKIPDNSVDIVLSDPPYNIGKDFGTCKDDMELNSYLEYIIYMERNPHI